jgi:hypothetical protein
MSARPPLRSGRYDKDRGQAPAVEGREPDDDDDDDEPPEDWVCGFCGREDGEASCWVGWPYTTATCPYRRGTF